MAQTNVRNPTYRATPRQDRQQVMVRREDLKIIKNGLIEAQSILRKVIEDSHRKYPELFNCSNQADSNE